ncbi:MAG: lysophospholipid acyltransferase family protein [Hyphomicrobiaceae bacterium]|mgnify:CR=1 FL=1
MIGLRAGTVLAVFFALTVPLMPVQLLLVRTGSRYARTFPHWYHKQVCRLLGIRIKLSGSLAPGQPVLLIANHVSWLDIPVLSAVAPLSFIAKQEVAGWPFVGWLAKLQRSVFVNRNSRATVADQAIEIAERLEKGETIVLFAEGTTGDGLRVLPFKSSLLGAALPSRLRQHRTDIAVQSLAICYPRLCGLPIGRDTMPLIAWYGDMDVPGHAWGVLKAGPVDVTVAIGPPLPHDEIGNRKAVARHAEAEVKAAVRQALRPARLEGKSPALDGIAASR